MANTKSLVHLAARVSDLEQALLENDGVLPPELEQHFDLTTGDLREKVDRYKYVIDALFSRAEYFKKLEADMRAAKKAFENQAEALRERMRYVLTTTASSEIVGNDWRFKLASGKDRLVIGKDLPDEYMKEVVERVPDKEAIETALKMGFEVPGCSIEPGHSLRVYVNAEAKAKDVKEIES